MIHEQLDKLIVVLAAGAGVAIAAKRIAVPYNVALVIAGLVLSVLRLVPAVGLDPEMVFDVFLPALVFEGALLVHGEGLRLARREILALAVPGVAVSLIGTAAVATIAIGLPFSTALLLGAVLAATDTISVLVAFRAVRVPHRLAAIMEGETLFNDGTALVLVALAATIVGSGQFDAGDTAREFVVAMAGGVVLGAATGVAGAAVLRRTPDHLTAIVASIVVVFGTSEIAVRVGASPVVAVVVAGLAVGRTTRVALSPSHALALRGFWETAGFVLNVLLFLVVGMQIEPSQLVASAPAILLALLALHAGRAFAVYGCFAVLRAATGERMPWRWQHAMVLGNIKGAISMAAVLALPADLPHRGELVVIVFGVALMTLVTQALPFGRMLRMLGIEQRAADEDLERARTSLIAARRGQAELDELLRSGLISRSAHAQRRAAFQRVVIAAEAGIRTSEHRAIGDRSVDMSLLVAQKSALTEAAGRGLISGALAQEQIEAVDRDLLALAMDEEAAE